MKAAVIGSRSFTDYEKLKTILEGYPITEIVSGGAIGADSLAERYATEKGLDLTLFYPDWKAFGPAAGPIRNERIVERADEVFAFWDMKSKGTLNSIGHAHKQKKVCHIINVAQDPFDDGKE